MDEPKYISKVRIVRERGPVRSAYLPAEAQPVMFGTHDEVREHYGTAPGQYPDHATTLDYVVAAAAGSPNAAVLAAQATQAFTVAVPFQVDVMTSVAVR